MSDRTDIVWKGPALAAVYLEGVRGAIPLAREQLDVMLRLLKIGARPVRRFLDLGCGDGVLADAILRRFPVSQAVLVDFSTAMLEAARRRFEGRSSSARLVNVDYGDPCWTRLIEEFGPFDAIVSGYSIHHQTDARKLEIYREIFGLLEPGGVFLNVEHVASASEWGAKAHDELFIDGLLGLHHDQSRNAVAETYYRRPDKAANILAPVDLQCRWLREIGFADVDCFLKIFELALFGGRRPGPP